MITKSDQQKKQKKWNKTKAKRLLSKKKLSSFVL